MRTMIAFSVAPLAVPLIATAYFASLGMPEDALSAVLAVSAIVAYGGTLVLGAPLYLFLREHVTAFAIAPAVGFIAGALVMCVLVGRNVSADALGFGGLSGAAVGAIFWLIARPDRRTQ
jgi:MFS-type transporter involved in bile tolerance (Atg22 family)